MDEAIQQYTVFCQGIKNESYGHIACSYSEFTIKHYENATVIFEGYEPGPFIKYNTHQWHGQIPHWAIRFNAATESAERKDDFLSLSCNKQAIIYMVAEEQLKRSYSVIDTSGIADMDIVKAAVKSWTLYPTTMIGKDTYLFNLLLYYAHLNNRYLYFRPDKPAFHKVYNTGEMKRILGSNGC